MSATRARVPPLADRDATVLSLTGACGRVVGGGRGLDRAARLRAVRVRRPARAASTATSSSASTATSGTPPAPTPTAEAPTPALGAARAYCGSVSFHHASSGAATKIDEYAPMNRPAASASAKSSSDVAPEHAGARRSAATAPGSNATNVVDSDRISTAFNDWFTISP